MPKNILRRTPKKVQKIIEGKTEAKVGQIIEQGRKKSWKNLPKRQIIFIKNQVSETVLSYPPKARPIIASIMTICYFSIVPGAGTASLIFFGTLGKILKKITHYS